MFILLGYEFMQRALLASLLGGVTCGIAGVWVILLNIPFIGVAMSHSAFAGAVFGLLFGINPLLCGAVFCVIAAFLIGPVADRGDISPNVSIGIIFSFVLGLAFLGIGLMKGPRSQALNFMWGSILTVSGADIFFLSAVTAGILIFLKLLQKEIMAVLFNRRIAKASGINEKLIFYSLLIICGLTVAFNLSSIGGLLIFSLITGSPLAAYQLTNKLKTMYMLSALFSVLSCFTGLIVSYFLNLPSGAAVVIVSSSIFILSLIFSQKRRSKKNEPA